MDISMVCTGHGPVLVGDRIKSVMKQYREWSTVVNPNPKKTVIIPYVSAYGYTKSLAEKIAEGVKDSGDIDVRSYDMVEADAAKVNEELLFADGILLGTPTIVGEALKPIWDLTLGMFRRPTAANMPARSEATAGAARACPISRPSETAEDEDGRRLPCAVQTVRGGPGERL